MGKPRKNRRYKINNKGEIITKHNAEVCGRKNTKDFENNCSIYADIGDLSGHDIKLQGHVSNSLKKKLDQLYQLYEDY